VIALAVAWVPVAIIAPVWVDRLLPPEDQAKGFAIGLVHYVLPLVLVMLYIVSLLARSRAMSLASPFNVARTITGGTSPFLGRLVRLTGSAFTIPTLRWLAIFAFIGAIVAGALSDKMLQMQAFAPALKVLAGTCGVVFTLSFIALIILMILPSPLRSPLDQVARRIDRMGQQMLQPSASDLRTVDRRKPVLLLRSFNDDNLKIRGRSEDVRMEEALADALPGLGPLIGIGRPGETLPDLGASRNYYTDQVWRDAVAAWMKEALLIVVIAGNSSGLQWEIETIAGQSQLPKLLVFMPPVEQKQRWNNLKIALGRLLDGNGSASEMPRGLLCLHGTPDGNLAMVASNSSSAEDYRRAIAYALFGMFCSPPAATR
jgi:hypothetical protein